MSELIDLQEAERFVVALTGDVSTRLCWQTFADREEDKKDEDRKRELARHRDLPLRVAATWLADANRDRAGIYVTVNHTDGRGRLVSNVTGLRALFVDCDGSADLSTVQWPLLPSIVVQRDDTHWHAYWLLETGEALGDFTPAQVQLAAFYRSDVSVKDLSRVMRVPGFSHWKGEPIQVRLPRATSTRYRLAQVLAAHPVDWSTFSEEVPEERPYRKAAEACGLVEAVKASPAPAPTSSRSQAPGAGKPPMVEMMHRYMLKLPTMEGTGNERGGRDNTAFFLACECAARDLHQGDTENLVREYFQRSGGGSEADVQRVCRSAYSKPRTTKNLPRIYDETQEPARAPRWSRAPQADEDAFGDPAEVAAGDGGEPPASPPARSTSGGDDEPPVSPWARDLELPKLLPRWSIGAVGVWPFEINNEGEWKPRPNKRVCDLPIWPAQQGRDEATGDAFWMVRWVTPAGSVREQWMAEVDLKLGAPLVALPDGPVAKRLAENCSVWLTAARSAVKAEVCRVTSRVGWCGTGDARKWVWPSGGADGVRYIGADLGEGGDLEVWRQGVDHLVSLGAAGFPGLVALGFAAGAAWSRLNGPTPRNPILGLMGPSSTGKGTIMGYALSLWCNPDHLSLPASSTAKGLQDRAAGIPDLPILVDELQQLAERDPRQAADALYYLANGQRRITSSKTQQAVGGERRFGAGFYAAEAPILQGQNTGVHYRCIELADVAFVPDEASAKAIQAGIRAAGAAGPLLAEHLNATPVEEWRRILEGYAAAWREALPERRGDDAQALSLVQMGLEALGKILDLDLRPPVVLEWLKGHLVQQRAHTTDRETQALHHVLDAVLNGNWSDDEKAGPGREYSAGRDGPVAWRLVAEEPGAFEPEDDSDTSKIRQVVARLEINPAVDPIRRLIVDQGGQERLLRAWAKREWIQTDGRHLTVRKTHRGSPVGRVVKFTPKALATYYDFDPESALYRGASEPAPASARPQSPEEEPPF